MTPIGRALREAMDTRGLTVADLARELGVKEPTIRNVYNGSVEEPHKPLRDAFDRYFAPGLPLGTTLRICKSTVAGYPSDPLRELVRLAQPLPSSAVEHLVEFLRDVS